MDLWWINKTIFPPSEGQNIYCEQYTQSSTFFPAISFSLSLSYHQACDNTLTVHQDVSADLIASSDVICLESSSQPEKCNIFWSTSDPKKPQILQDNNAAAIQGELPRPNHVYGFYGIISKGLLQGSNWEVKRGKKKARKSLEMGNNSSRLQRG